MTKAISRAASSQLEGWFQASQFSNQQQRAKTPQEEQFLHAVWPMCEPYFSPIRLTYLLRHLDFDSLRESPLWLVRDGLIPILWFFRMFPDPRKINTRLLVHADFASAVPPSWRNNAGTYEVVSVNSAPHVRRKRERFIIAGPFGESICSVQALASKLDRLKSEVGPSKLWDFEAALFLPARASIAQTKTSDYFHSFCLKMLFETFGGTNAKIRFLDWMQMRWEDGYSGDIMEFNDRLLWADNFLVHHILSNGGRIAGESDYDPSKKKGELISLSPHHGFLVNYDLRRIGPISRSDLEAHKRALSGPGNRSYPWHAWMSPPK